MKKVLTMLVLLSVLMTTIVVPVSAETVTTKHIIEFTNVLQKPELPTGCEAVSLTMLLNHYGYNIDKITLCRKYLPKRDFWYVNGERYGADFMIEFAGNPESSGSYGCYPPCIVKTVENYFAAVGSNDYAVDLTGTSLDTLFAQYIEKDTPVLIWITYDNLHDPVKGRSWKTKDGKTVTWTSKEHCVVLTGFDRDKKLVYVSDPLVGNTTYPLDRLEKIYNVMGKNAVQVVVEKSTEIDDSSTFDEPIVVNTDHALGDINVDGQVNAFDYQILKAIVVGGLTIPKEMIAQYDVVPDGFINAFDYQVVKTIALGIYRPKS